MQPDNSVGEAPDPAIPELDLKQLARSLWPWAVAVGAVLVVLLVVGLWLGGRVRWGDIATWVVAVTTLLAFLAAAFAGVVAYRVLELERRRDQLADSARIAAQASLVAAWFERLGDSATHASVPRGPALDMTGWGALVNNDSGLPVYDVRVYSCPAPQPGSGPEWQQLIRPGSPEPISVVPPGLTRVGLRGGHPERDEVGIGDRDEADGTRWLIAIEFTDAAGVRWVRDPRGRLSPVPARQSQARLINDRACEGPTTRS